MLKHTYESLVQLDPDEILEFLAVFHGITGLSTMEDKFAEVSHLLHVNKQRAREEALAIVSEIICEKL
jgi:hypothetical protein